jgi:hypothetical protein
MTAMQEFVVPKSIPSIFAIKGVPYFEFSVAIIYLSKLTIRGSTVSLYGVKTYEHFL